MVTIYNRCHVLMINTNQENIESVSSFFQPGSQSATETWVSPVSLRQRNPFDLGGATAMCILWKTLFTPPCSAAKLGAALLP